MQSLRETPIFFWPPRSSDRWIDFNLGTQSSASTATRSLALKNPTKSGAFALDENLSSLLLWKSYENYIELAKVSKNADLSDRDSPVCRMSFDGRLSCQPVLQVFSKDEIFLYVSTFSDSKSQPIIDMLKLNFKILQGKVPNIDPSHALKLTATANFPPSTLTISSLCTIQNHIVVRNARKYSYLVAGTAVGSLYQVTFTDDQPQIGEIGLPISFDPNDNVSNKSDGSTAKDQEKASSKFLSRWFRTDNPAVKPSNIKRTIMAMIFEKLSNCLFAVNQLGKVLVLKLDLVTMRLEFIAQNMLPFKLSRTRDHIFVQYNGPVQDMQSPSIFLLTSAEESTKTPRLRTIRLSLRNFLSLEILDLWDSQKGPLEPAAGMLISQSGDLILALENGAIGFVSGDDFCDSLILDNVWTLNQDYSDPRGLACVFDAICPDSALRLLTPWRYSTSVLAQVIGHPELDEADHPSIMDHLNNFLGQQEQTQRVDTLNRVVQDANTLSMNQDLTILGTSNVGLGSNLILRNFCASILRPTFPEEKLFLFQAKDDSSSNLWPTSIYSDLLAPVALLQNASIKSLAENEAYRMVLKFGSRPSDHDRNIFLSQLACKLVDVEESNLQALVDALVPFLDPGSECLEFLFKAREFTALAYAAETVTPSFPASSCYCAAYAAIQLAEEPIESSIIVSCSELFTKAANSLIEGTSAGDLETIARILSLDAQKKISEVLFWFRASVVRLFESKRADQTAGLFAYEAFKSAPDEKNYEQMRFIAFKHFLSLENLEAALETLLADSFQTEQPKTQDLIEDCGGLRDALNLLVVTAADMGKLQWLASQNLPSPISTLVANALFRRASFVDPLSRPKTIDHSKDRAHYYEDLFSWFMYREDACSAALVAYRWYCEMNSKEGMNGRKPDVWLRERGRALHQASCALKLLPPPDQWLPFNVDNVDPNIWMTNKRSSLDSRMNEMLIEPTDISALLNDVLTPSSNAVFTTAHLSRRIYLIHCQKYCYRNVSQERPLPGLFWSDSIEAVEWVIGSLCEISSISSIEMAQQLSVTWSLEVGHDNFVRRVVAAGVEKAMNQSTWTELRDQLYSLERWRDENRASLCGACRNYHLHALEILLNRSGGAFRAPPWLEYWAMWGVDETTVLNDTDLVCCQGDIAAVIRLYIKYDKVYDCVDLIRNALLTKRYTKSVLVSSKAMSARGMCYGLSYTLLESLLAHLKVMNTKESLEKFEGLKADIESASL